MGLNYLSPSRRPNVNICSGCLLGISNPGPKPGLTTGNCIVLLPNPKNLDTKPSTAPDINHFACYLRIVTTSTLSCLQRTTTPELCSPSGVLRFFTATRPTVLPTSSNPLSVYYICLFPSLLILFVPGRDYPFTRRELYFRSK